MMSASEPLEDAVLQLTTYDYSRKEDLKGSCPLFTTDVYQLTAEKEDPTWENPGEGRVLANQLAKHYNVDQYNSVSNVLETWAESITNTKHVEDNCSVWVSDHLHLDLSIPITRSPPNGFCLQAVFLGKHLPPFILTLYDKCKTANEEEFRDFTTECSQLLTASIINFGHTDFVLLPCVLARDRLNPTTLEEEVAEQVKFSRRYYRGPRQLNVAAYKDLKKAVTAVSAVSYVPFFLQGRKTDKKWLLLLEETWRKLLSLIIDRVHHGETCPLPSTPEKEFKVKVAAFEAVARLGLTQEVSIETSFPDVTSCVTQIVEHIKDEYAVDISGNVTVKKVSPDSTIVISSSGQKMYPKSTSTEELHSKKSDTGLPPTAQMVPKTEQSNYIATQRKFASFSELQLAPCVSPSRKLDELQGERDWFCGDHPVDVQRSKYKGNEVEGIQLGIQKTFLEDMSRAENVSPISPPRCEYEFPVPVPRELT